MVETDSARGRERERERSTPAVDPRPVKAKSNCRHLCDLQFDLAFLFVESYKTPMHSTHVFHGNGSFLFVEVTFALNDRTRPVLMCSLTLA